MIYSRDIPFWLETLDINTGPTSPITDPITPSARQGSQQIAAIWFEQVLFVNKLTYLGTLNSNDQSYN